MISVTALALAMFALFQSFFAGSDFLEEDTSVLPPSDVPALELDESTLAGSSRSLFKPPADIESAIETALASTVTIKCGEVQGTGWAIALTDPAAAGGVALPSELATFPGRLVTNHHVISDCVDAPGSVTALIGDKTYESYMYSWDPENDLAIVLTSAELAPLPLSTQPEPGWWAMSVGSPFGYAGSVSIGNVMNSDSVEVISTAPMNSGNSGGPLINAAGAVMGSTTYVTVSEDGIEPWNVSMALPALCSRLVNCTAEQMSWSE